LSNYIKNLKNKNIYKVMRKFSVLILFLLLISPARSQWVSNYGGNPGGDISLSNADGNAVTADNYGYSYVAGYVNNFGTGKDILVIKYSPAGDTLWTRTYNGSDNQDDEAFGIAVDDAGNIYVTGEARISGKYYETILIKYSSSGSQIWAKTYGATAGNNADKATAIALDNLGNIYVTGYCTSPDLHHDIVTMKYDANGNRKWVKLEDGLDNLDAEGCGIAIDNQSNVLVTGFCTTNLGGKDIVVLKYNTNNALIWMRTFNGNYNNEDKAWGIVVDQTDNVYITGYTTSAYNNTDCITLKFDAEGNNQWTSFYNGNGNSNDKAWGIVVDTDGSVYITGETTDEYNNINYITLKYNNIGTAVWTSYYNGTGNGTDAADAIGLFTDANNIKNVVVTGKSWGTQLNYDYATVKYNAVTGSQTQVSRYSLNGLTNDIAEDLYVSDNLNTVYVTGCSELIAGSKITQSSVSTMMLDWSKSTELTTESNTPKKFELHQNYPNPFNPSTTIKFDISVASKVKLTVYDMLGRIADVLVNQDLSPGSYNFTFTSNDLSSGIYFYEMSAGDFKEIRKMTLVK
jgi:uncharacterized delta-60 repeat protein